MNKLNVKQFKKRFIRGLVEPELFYMPWGKKEEKIQKLFISSRSYRVHNSTTESAYHGWEKYTVINIENIKLNNGDILLSNQKIGYYDMFSGTSATGFVLETQIRESEINNYGTTFRFICKKQSWKYNCHKNTLLGCVNTARSIITFSSNGRSYDFYLLSLYKNTIDEFLKEFLYGYLEWKIYYNVKDNSIKSYLILRDIDDYNTIIKQSDIITVYKNFI